MFGLAKTFIGKIVSILYGLSMLDDVSWGTGLVARVMEEVQNASGVTSAVAIYNVLRIVGYVLIILLFFIAITDSAINGKLTFEYLVKNGIRSVIACFLVANGFSLLIFIFKVASILLRDVSALAQNITGGEENYNYVVSAISSYVGSQGLGAGIGAFLSMMIPYALSFIVGIVIKATLIVVALEIVIRAVLAPIALADIYGDSLRPHAVVYLKNFLATCVQMAAIVGIVMAFGILNSILIARDPKMAEASEIVAQYTTEEDIETADDRLDAAILLEGSGLIPNEIDDEEEETAKYTEEEVTQHMEGLTSTADEQMMAAQRAADAEEEIGRVLYSTLFSMSRMIGFLAMMLALILAIAKTRDIARLIVGL